MPSKTTETRRTTKSLETCRGTDVPSRILSLNA